MRILPWGAACAVLAVLAVPTGLDSCAIGPPEPIFAAVTRPANLDRFLEGKLGVLRRSYEERYRIAAFRMLAGKPLTEAERSAVFPPYGPSVDRNYGSPAMDKWIGLRRSVKGVKPEVTIERYKAVRPPDTYRFRNCQEAAFDAATETLVELRQQWPNDDPRLVEWVRGQDQVFENCSGDAPAPVIPADAAPDADPLLAAYRRYQIAAALFYSGQHRKASEAFLRIAEDENSPWRGYGPYLSARALLRAGMLDGDAAAFQEGKAALLAILNDPDRSDWHENCLDLLHLWQIRVEPEVRLAELGAELMAPSEEDRSQAVIDFIHLMRPTRKEADRKRQAATGELAAWLVAMAPDPPRDLGGESVSYWQKTGNPAWLIAALANAGDRDLPALFEAARRIGPGSPAYESIAYYATTREIARGNRAAARGWADRALRQNLERPSRNLILEERIKVAVDWSEFLRFAVRRREPSLVFYDNAEVNDQWGEISTEGVFDRDVITAFNNALPLSLWLDASRNKLVPAHMQLEIAEAGWARALQIGKSDEARSFMQRVVELNPAVSTGAAFLGATGPEDALHAALYIVLRTPSLWPKLHPPLTGPPDLAYPRHVATDAYGRRSGCWDAGLEQKYVRAIDFLTAEQRAAASAEVKQILATKPWDAGFLLSATLEWAKAKPDDPHVPEALHRAVMAARYRCGSDPKLSRQAFSLLHRQYPKSPWTAKTKYWY
jgi:hypothetical protein